MLYQSCLKKELTVLLGPFLFCQGSRRNFLSLKPEQHLESLAIVHMSNIIIGVSYTDDLIV